MYRIWEKFSKPEQDNILKQAASTLKRLETL